MGENQMTTTAKTTTAAPVSIRCSCGAVHEFTIPIHQAPPRLGREKLAEHYGVSLATVDRWRERGCPYINIGRPEFNIEDVETWMKKHANQPRRKAWRSA
jgi:hypothetical protein